MQTFKKVIARKLHDRDCTAFSQRGFRGYTNTILKPWLKRFVLEYQSLGQGRQTHLLQGATFHLTIHITGQITRSRSNESAIWLTQNRRKLFHSLQKRSNWKRKCKSVKDNVKRRRAGLINHVKRLTVRLREQMCRGPHMRMGGPRVIHPRFRWILFGNDWRRFISRFLVSCKKKCFLVKTIFTRNIFVVEYHNWDKHY